MEEELYTRCYVGYDLKFWLSFSPLLRGGEGGFDVLAFGVHLVCMKGSIQLRWEHGIRV